ncbi:UNKNOWN [Stylonychia lemnae]|uniref:Uncharacterized protein n=1 Tax=Stylonychia lemnae TaxID=5949 RepID=A0A077ZPX7_STYLE|nr:UNKNOWN [Stylonychia lemnae]|eukprot:CDW71953.1 UNKNOWN [Stylonychia lemnae]
MNNDKNVESLALYSLFQKLEEQKVKMINSQDPALFENTSQNILATLKQVNSVKGWNDLVNTMLAAEESEEQLIHRPINGSAELYLMECQSPEADKIKQQMIQCMDEIENTELELINMEDKENINSNIRNKKILQREMKLRINRLQEQYEKLYIQFKKVNSL